MNSSSQQQGLSFALEDERVFDACENWYDVFACCYMKISESIISEENLIGGYFTTGKEESFSNPNYSVLLSLAERVRRLAQDNWNNLGLNEGRQAISQLLDYLAALNLQPFGDNGANALTPWLAVMAGIDMACQDVREFERLKTRGPLNNSCFTSELAVFLKPKNHIVNDVVNAFSAGGKTELTFNSQLNAIQAHRLETSARCHPLIVSARRGRRSSDNKRVVKIGFGSFSKSAVIGEEGDGSLAFIKRGAGNSFSIGYSEGYAERYAEGVVAVIRRAILEDCDFLLFPELVISPELRKVIADELRRFQGGHSLCLVAAGSGWDQGNNVGVIIDAYGNVIGECFKNHPFVKRRKGKGHEDEEDWPFFNTGTELVEGLADPGAKLTMVDVPGLGRVLTVICKDLASESLYVPKLVRDYGVALVLCPSMSRSVNSGFTGMGELLASKYGAITCMCNLCGSRTDKAESEGGISFVSAPSVCVKEGWAGLGEPVVKRVRRNDGCSNRDDCRGACLHVATLDYGDCTEQESIPNIVVVGPIYCL